MVLIFPFLLNIHLECFEMQGNKSDRLLYTFTLHFTLLYLIFSSFSGFSAFFIL